MNGYFGARGCRSCRGLNQCVDAKCVLKNETENGDQTRGERAGRKWLDEWGKRK